MVLPDAGDVIVAGPPDTGVLPAPPDAPVAEEVGAVWPMVKLIPDEAHWLLNSRVIDKAKHIIRLSYNYLESGVHHIPAARAAGSIPIEAASEASVEVTQFKQVWAACCIVLVQSQLSGELHDC